MPMWSSSQYLNSVSLYQTSVSSPVIAATHLGLLHFFFNKYLLNTNKNVPATILGSKKICQDSRICILVCHSKLGKKLEKTLYFNRKTYTKVFNLHGFLLISGK